MTSKIWNVPLAAVLFLACPLAAMAGPCDAYYPFDGTLADASGNGNDGEMIAAGGATAKPTFTEGKSGQALQLDGTSAMRALLDLHYDTCPHVTISAWINVARDAPSDVMHVLSTGNGSGPGLTITNTFLQLRGTENGIGMANAVRKGSWMFVAGTYDYASGSYALYWGSRDATPGKLSEYRYPPENAFWVGTVNDDWGIFAHAIAVDELRITGRTLATDEVAALRSGAPATTVTSALTASPGGPTQLPGAGASRDINVNYDRPPDLLAGNPSGGATQVWSGAACESHDECAGRSYCGWDRMCHPEGHAPMREIELQTGTLPVPTLPAAGNSSADNTAAEEDSSVGSGPVPSGGAKYLMLDYDPSVLAYSGVSGGVGDRTEQAIFMQRRRFPYWIETRESYDKPCTVYVHAREVSSASADSEPLVTEYDVCDGGLPRINPLSTLRRALRNPEAGDFQPMTGIEVCNNGLNNRVKGIRARVRGVTIPGGKYMPDYSTVEFEQRSNCVSWQSMAHCPANTFAIGLRLHFRDGDVASPRDFLSGLELICADVRWMQSDGTFSGWEPVL